MRSARRAISRASGSRSVPRGHCDGDRQDHGLQVRLRQAGGGYFVYANVTGSPASVSADVSNITTGQNNVGLSSGSWTVNGVSYNYRSASQTASNPLSAGSKSYTVTPAAARARTARVTIDNTQPTATDVPDDQQGGQHRRAPGGWRHDHLHLQRGDRPVLAGRRLGRHRNHQRGRRITQSGSADPLTVWNPANTTQLPLGSVNTINSVGSNRTLASRAPRRRSR